MAIRRTVNRGEVVEVQQVLSAEVTATYPTEQDLKKLNSAKTNYIEGLEKRREIRPKG